jgi:hypothetical protein
MEENKITENKINLLKNAFDDNKSTISNLDVKARFLLAINLAFIAGIFIIFRFIYREDLICKFQEIYLISLITIGIIIILFNIFIIFLLINYVINPRNNPKLFIKNRENFPFLDEESIFFPIPSQKNNLFNYKNYFNNLEKLSIHQIEQIYLFELLNISFIRNLKINYLNKAIYYFNILMCTFCFYLIFILIYLYLFI